MPVGQDQAQHVEITRKFARKFNKAYGQVFPEPKVILSDMPELMSLTDPEKKMSKSEPSGCLFLDDSPEQIKQKIQKAVTTAQGVKNLHNLLKAFGINKKFERYSELKPILSETIIQALKPIQENKKQIKNIDEILQQGEKRASQIAQETIKQAKNKIGL